MAASVAPRSLSIFGNATFTTDSSTNASVDPSTAAASTQVLRAAHAGTVALARMTASAHGRALGFANQVTGGADQPRARRSRAAPATRMMVHSSSATAPRLR